MDMTLAQHNLSSLLDNGELKNKLLKTLETLQINNELSIESHNISQKNAKKQTINSFFKKAGGLLVGGGLLVVGGAALVSGVAPAIGAALAVGAAVTYGKTISSMMSPNSKIHLENNNAERANHDAGYSKNQFMTITTLANDYISSKNNNSPDTGEKIKLLIMKMKEVDQSSSYINSSNYKNVQNIQNQENKKPSMIEKFRMKLKSINNEQKDSTVNNKFKLK